MDFLDIHSCTDAHIFQEADFGIIGDYKEALPSIIDKLKSILND